MGALERLLHQLENPGEVDWREDAYDLADCSCLTDDEKAVYADKLLAAAHTGDSRALLTLGFIGAPGASGNELETLARGSDPLSPVARRAMVQMGRGQEFVEQIADDVLHSPSTMLRIAAAMQLAQLDGPVAKAAVLGAMIDANDVVRSTAWDGFIALYKLKPAISNPERVRELQTFIEIWGGYLLCDAKSIYELGADEMRWIARYLDAGTPPATLSIAWKPEAIEQLMQTFRLALIEEDKPFPVDEMQALTGFERRSCEALLAYRLEKFDLRGVNGLVALNAAWAVPMLDELATAEKCPPDVSAAMKSASATLSPLVTPHSIYSNETPEKPIEHYERALASALGSPVVIEYGDEIGNPRDGFWRDAKLTAYRPPGHIGGPPLRIVMRLAQDIYVLGMNTEKTPSGLRSIDIYGDNTDPAIAKLQDALAKLDGPRHISIEKVAHVKIRQLEHALVSALGSSVLFEYGKEEGNPPNGYFREAKLTVERPSGSAAGPAMRVVMTVMQDMYFRDDPESVLKDTYVYGATTDPAIATLVEELTKLGYEVRG